MKLKRSFLYLVLFFNFFKIYLNIENSKNFDINKTNSIEENIIDYGFYSSLFQSLVLIFISEIGDNTFILCLLFSRQANKFSIFSIATTSLLLMNVFSVILGSCIIYLVYKKIINWFAILVLLIYGIWLIDESRHIDSYDYMESDEEKISNTEKKDEEKEEEEVKKESDNFLNYFYLSKRRYHTTSPKTNFVLSVPEYMPSNDKKDEEVMNLKIIEETHLDSGQLNEEDNSQNRNIFWVLFTSILAGEFGDRSQILTIVISSIFNFYGVLIGTCLAHCFSVYFAVYHGKFIIRHISEKVITILSGLLLIIITINFYLMKIK